MSDRITATDPATDQANATSAATEQRWVAFGPAGAVGSVTRTPDGFGVRLLADADYRGMYPTLDVAKSALHASMLAGSDWPEFREH